MSEDVAYGPIFHVPTPVVFQRIKVEDYKGRWHPAFRCAGTACVVHNPSEHRMRAWPSWLRNDTLIERECEHKVMHPDPDSLDYFTRRRLFAIGLHECDGCCLTIEVH